MINKKEYLVNLGIFALFLAADLMANKFPKAAQTYPKMICIVGMILVVLLTVKMLVNDRKTMKDAKKLEEVQKANKEKSLKLENYKRIAIFMSMLFVYIFCIKRVGYFVSTIVYLTGSISVFRKKFHWANIVIAAVFSLLMYLVFDRFLHIMIPHGILY